MKTITLEQAKAQYVHRYTMEHKPVWANSPCNNGKYYAPNYRTDREWFEATTFPGESDLCPPRSKHCMSQGQTWPLGQWLDEPFTP